MGAEVVNVALVALLGAGIGYSLYLLSSAFRRPSETAATKVRVARRRAALDFRALADRWRRLLIAAAGGVLAAAFTGWPVLLVMVPVAIWYLPAALGPDRESTAWAERAEACAGFAEMLRDTLAAASGLQQAVASAAAVPPAAIAGPLRVLADDLRHGVRLAPALIKLSDTLADPIADRICATLIHASTRPAKNLAPVLGMLATDAREQALAMRKTMAERARTRTAVRTITGVIISMLCALLAADSEYLAPFGTMLGQLDLAVAGGLFAVGFAWLYRMTRPVVPHRFLTRLDRVTAARRDAT
ncbi:tight adherence protein B [Catenulispora sp. GAS73]|uniref:type II secretion system F family protein n=1 Tax=Catenulispora sp. GAS73 TaxID=3156269 RepID=UPI003515D304